MKKIIMSMLLMFHASFSNSVEIVPPNSMPQLPAQIPSGISLPQIEPNTIYSETKNPSLQFSNTNINSVFNLMFAELLKKSYVLSPEINEDTRLVSFRYNSKKDGDLERFINNFVDSLGYEMKNKNGVIFITPSKKNAPEKLLNVFDLEVEIYKPEFKDANYIIQQLRPIFPQAFTTTQSISATPEQSQKVGGDNPVAGSAAGMISQQSDVIMYKGTKDQIEKITQLIKKLDVKQQDVLIRSYIYEVTLTENNQSALSIVSNLLSNKLQIQVGSPSEALTSFVKFSTSAFTVLFSQISSDNRFKLLSNPIIRAKNSKKSRLMIGQEVPTLGSVSYAQSSSTPVQSVEYKSSGLILEITPTIKEEIIDLNLNQTLSDFIPTNTGVNNSPTLTKREITNNFSLSNNETVILGGLIQEKNSDNVGKSFFGLIPSSSKDNLKTEIIMIINVEVLK